MLFLTVAFLVSLLVNLMLIRVTPHDGRLRTNQGPDRPQRFHVKNVPRLGGIGILVALVAGVVLAAFHRPALALPLGGLLACAVPTFASGLAEDLMDNVSPRRRLLLTAASASLAVWLLDAVIIRTQIPGIDALIVYFPFAIGLTVFAVTGVANSFNIIDGFNGLASMCSLIIAVAIAYVAYAVGDQLILIAALLTAGAVLGFFVWNFPGGLIFLGDCGAYLLGFVLAELSLLLLRRNDAVSPMFPLLLCVYPIFETVFTMYRRKVVQRVGTATPDAIHLHTLIHRRLLRWKDADSRQRRHLTRNSMTSPYLWTLCVMSAVPSVLWWDNSHILACCIGLFMVIYVLLYRSIVRFRTPKWMVWRRG